MTPVNKTSQPHLQSTGHGRRLRAICHLVRRWRDGTLAQDNRQGNIFRDQFLCAVFSMTSAISPGDQRRYVIQECNTTGTRQNKNGRLMAETRWDRVLPHHPESAIRPQDVVDKDALCTVLPGDERGYARMEAQLTLAAGYRSVDSPVGRWPPLLIDPERWTRPEGRDGDPPAGQRRICLCCSTPPEKDVDKPQNGGSSWR